LLLKGVKQRSSAVHLDGSADGAVMEGELTVKARAFASAPASGRDHVIGRRCESKFKVKLRKG